MQLDRLPHLGAVDFASYWDEPEAGDRGFAADECVQIAVLPGTPFDASTLMAGLTATLEAAVRGPECTGIRVMSPGVVADLRSLAPFWLPEM
jgi:hypothetical protein